MRPTTSEYESLLNWIAPDGPSEEQEQINWIHRYLSNKNLLVLMGDFSCLSGTHEDLALRFRHNLDRAEFRELIRQMRSAWHQYQYRKKKGRQVSFQLPESTVKKLDKLASHQNQSRTQALISIINSAAIQRQEEKKSSREISEKMKIKLTKINNDKMKSEALRDRVINNLLKKLMDETILRLCYEEAIYPVSEKEINELMKSIDRELVKKNMEAVESAIPDIKLLRPRIKRIEDLLPSDMESFTKRES